LDAYGVATKVTAIRGTSANAHEALKHRKGRQVGPILGSFDLAFIDGDHGYETVKRDTEIALDLIGEDGVIAWHDYNDAGNPGVAQYVDGLLGTDEGLIGSMYRQDKVAEADNLLAVRFRKL